MNFELYLEAYCGLVIPFPRLSALRSRPDLIPYFKEEYEDLLAKEREFLRKKEEAKRLFEQGKPVLP